MNVQLQMTPEFMQALLARLQHEYGEVSCSNFALSMQLEGTRTYALQLEQSLKEVQRRNEELQARCDSAEKELGHFLETAAKESPPRRKTVNGTDLSKDA